QSDPAGPVTRPELVRGHGFTQITAICEYLEELHPNPPVIGSTPEQRAECRKWPRRIDLNICEPMANGFRFSQGLPLFKDRIVTVPEAADGLKRMAQDRLAWLNREMEGKEFV